MTPRRFVCFAKFTASRTLRHRLSGSDPGAPGTRACASSAWFRSMPQYETKSTASGVCQYMGEALTTHNSAASS
jgi:hypothetical protein